MDKVFSARTRMESLVTAETFSRDDSAYWVAQYKRRCWELLDRVEQLEEAVVNSNRLNTILFTALAILTGTITLLWLGVTLHG